MPKSVNVVVVQARTTSSRLPGKALLSLGGMPAAVLATKRAGNTGLKTILVTSNHKSDDYLASTCEEHGINVFRGDLTNVLNRYLSALAKYPDDTTVTRLTADNIMPDGKLIAEIETDFRHRNLHYISTNDDSGLPYGVSVEMFKLRDLRAIVLEDCSPYDKEHVTSALRRRYGSTAFQKYKFLNMQHYRATVDCLDDYLTVSSIVKQYPCIVKAPWLDLVKALKGSILQPQHPRPVPKLILGGAQLGLKYGMVSKGLKSLSERRKLIKLAIVNGVGAIDTARAYGESEAVIGSVLSQGWAGRIKVFTKLSPLGELTKFAPLESISYAVESSVLTSCLELGVKKIDMVSIHRASHLTDWEGIVLKQLRVLKKEGRISKIGLSVQSPDELELALDIKDIDCVQIPINILDWRWDRLLEKIEIARNTRGLVVHIRSVLLQGLISANKAHLWKKANVENPAELSEWLNRLVGELKLITPHQLALTWAASLNWVDGIVLGIDDEQQLIDNMRILDCETFSKNVMNEISSTRYMLCESSLNPVKWSK